MRTTILSLTLLLMSVASFGSTSDSTFQRHQLHFSMTNGMSHTFFNSYRGVSQWNYMAPTITYNPEGGGGSDFPGQYLPSYAAQLEAVYSFGISDHFRIESGVGYLLLGYTLNDSKAITAYDIHLFIGVVNVPLHFKFIKALKRGNFTTTLGPDFFFPMHWFTFGKRYNSQSDYLVHATYSASTTTYYSSLGFDLKMGYEKKVKSNLSIDIGPVVSFNNLVLFNKGLRNHYSDTQSRPYQYYIGLDVAVNFGLGK